MVECKKCGRSNNKGFKFCVYCGEKLPMPEDFCPECVKTYPDYYSFCPECGTKLVDETLPEYCEIRKNKYLRESDNYERDFYIKKDIKKIKL